MRTEVSCLSRDFLHACQSGDVSRLKALAAAHRVSDWTEFRYPASGDTGLHVAAREGNLNVTRFLCEAFDRPEFRADVLNRDMKRPLHEAAQFARSEVLNYLLSKGATVDSFKRADWTPLMLACTKTGREACECIAALLEAGANPCIRNKDGWPPFLIACRSGDEDAFQLLVKRCPESIHHRSNNGRSALHIAAFHGHDRLIELLTSMDPGLLSAKDSAGSTPLHEAVKNGHFGSTKLLMELGADVRAVDNVGQTVLHVAALAGHLEIVEHFLGRNLIDVDAEAHFGVTPLIAAERGERKEIVECLNKYGAGK